MHRAGGSSVTITAFGIFQEGPEISSTSRCTVRLRLTSPLSQLACTFLPYLSRPFAQCLKSIRGARMLGTIWTCWRLGMVVGPRVQTKATSSKNPWRNILAQTQQVSLAVLDVACLGECRYRTEFSMWAILASPLVVTTPLTNMHGCDDVNCVSEDGRHE